MIKEVHIVTARVALVAAGKLLRKYKWDENEPLVRKALSIHNKDPEYDPNHAVAQIKSLDAFEKVVKGAGRLAVGICFHDAS